MSDTTVSLDFDIPVPLPHALPVLPLRQGALLPGNVVPLTVGRKISLRAVEAALSEGKRPLIIVAVQREPVGEPKSGDLLPVATLARVVERRQERGRPAVVVVQGLARVGLRGFLRTHPYLEAAPVVLPQDWSSSAAAEGLLRAVRDEVGQSGDVLRGTNTGAMLLGAPLEAPLFLDAVGGHLEAPPEVRKQLLQLTDPAARADKLLGHLQRAREVTAAQKAVRERMQKDAHDLQKEHVLRRQLKAIQEELGEGGGDDELGRLKERLAAIALPDEVQRVVDRELKRLDRINGQSPERSVALDWLEWVSEMPWGVHSAVEAAAVASEEPGADLRALEAALDRSHFGLDEVKRQVVEHLSVRKLSGTGRADVLLLVGPPGVGKTSIGQAIADATGRKLVRVALGGMRDESQLRGHRRTYIGARPGRLIEGLRRAGTADPVVLLDEVDKLGRGMQGDPAAALLEILDPEQNHAFTDHYLDVPFDLSRALFIATANDLSTIPGPLRDRMEVLDIAGYTAAEKVAIAEGHLLEKLAENAGIEPEEVQITQAAIADVVAGWTREAGVRGLQRALGRIFRAAAVRKAKGELSAPLQVDVADLPTYLKRRRFTLELHDLPPRPGIATGLAWTPVGGDVLYVEASTMPGKGNLVLTGQLGDVMKESARAALTYVLSNAAQLGIPADAIAGKDVHLHVPAGAVPKDGPSAGVTMFTALASLLTGRPVLDDVAMTGEATLRGRVLPVGGIKSKVLGAHRRGIRRVVLPRRNEGDLVDVPDEARQDMQFILVDTMEEVIQAALGDVVPVSANQPPPVSARESGAA